MLKRMEFRVLPFLEDDNPVPYYAIGFRHGGRGNSWQEVSELFRGFNPIWSDHQREIMKMKFSEESEAIPFLREFKRSLRDISIIDIVKRGGKKTNSTKIESNEQDGEPIEEDM